MKTALVCLVIFMIAILALVGFKIYLDHPMSSRSYFLSPSFYYELPSGGYIYIEDEFIRYNPNEFNEQLDYRITLNYVGVNK